MVETETLAFFHSVVLITGSTSVPNKVNLFLLEVKPTFIRSIFLYYLYLLIFSSLFFNLKLQLWQLICKELYLSLFVHAHLMKLKPAKAELSHVQVTILVWLKWLVSLLCYLWKTKLAKAVTESWFSYASQKVFLALLQLCYFHLLHFCFLMHPSYYTNCSPDPQT